MAPPKGTSRNQNFFKSTNGENSNSPSLADTLSYSLTPKPFKDEKKKHGPRRNKTLKQILTAERLRANQVLNMKNSAEGDVEMSGFEDQSNGNNSNNVNSNFNDQQQQQQQLPTSNSKKSKKEALPIVNPDVNYITYMTIEAPPSVIPPRKYCDVTGLEAPYVDPKTRLRYHNSEVYELIKTFVRFFSPFYNSNL
ncbi:YL1 nuclear protein C-terminal domain-containing protein [Phakopsora pachyrhizi]|nr:YL1 nuclear protein C-terminal domain-containing protein [Phakopsora pachyrhizi]